MTSWKTYRLGDLCDTISDTYKGCADEVVLINTSDVLEGKCLNHTKEPNRNLKGQFKKTFKKNDILYSEIRPTNKRFAYIDFDATNYIASTKLMVLRHNEKIEPLYLYYILQSQSIIDELQMLAESRSGTFPQITFAELSRLEVKLPNRAVQRQILGILGAIDDKIENNRRINTNLELQAQALYKQWFVDFEFPNEEGKPYKSSGGKMVDSELGPIPEGWRVQTFGDLIKPQKGKNITRAQVTIGSVPVVAGGLMPSCYHNTSNTHCPVVTISASGANAGYVKMYHMPIWAADCSYIDDTISKYVHFAYVFLTYNQTSIYHKQQGCAQPHIYPSHLMELQFICPTLDILDKFESWSKKIYKLIGTNIQEIETLATLRDTLLPKLMNGEIKTE